MREWWLNLALREKKMVAMGALAITLFLLYEIVWSPLVNANNNLRTRIQHNQETLAWMQQADQRIELAHKTSEKNILPTGSLLGVMQTAIQQSPLANKVSQLRQADNESVQFNLKQVDFDQLIVFFTTLWKKQGVLVSQITVNPGGAPGEVAADVVVKRSV